MFTSEYASNASLLNRMSPCEDDVQADGSSYVIINSTLLASVDGTLVANVDVTLMLPDVNGTLVADIGWWLADVTMLADVTILAHVDGLLWPDDGTRCVSISYIIGYIVRPICTT